MGNVIGKFFWWSAHAVRKARCGKSVYKIMSSVIPSRIVTDAKPLESFRPDAGCSSICCNRLSGSPEYDLQIVIPAYNVAQYVDECVNSVLSQRTSFRYRTVIVNDGSTDGTAELLEKYADVQDVTVINQANKGLSGARNTGIGTIDARYVMFVDSDDTLAPDAVEVLMKKAYASGADIVEGGFERFDANGTLSVHPQVDSDDNRGLSGFAWGKVYRSALWKNICFPEGYWFEDSVCCAIVHPMAERIATVSDIVYRWRKNRISITALSKNDMRCVDSFWVTKRLVADCHSLGIARKREMLEYLVYQVKVTNQRVARMCNPELDRSVFVNTCELFRTYFVYEDFSFSSNPVVKSLFDRDYTGYVLACSLL